VAGHVGETRALTILHLAANRWWTGSADPVLRLVGGLSARGHRVLLGIIRGDRFEEKAREAGIAPLGGLDLRARGWPGPMVRDLVRLRALIRAERVDVVHAHHSHDHWLARLATIARGPRVPVVRTFHNRRSVSGGLTAAWLYRATAAVFAVSRGIEERCRAVGIPPERIVWTPGIADTARFGPEADGSAIRDEFELGNAPVVVTVSRLAANRGHEALVSGFQRVLARMPDARLLLVGKGEMRDRLERLVGERSLGDAVIFTGYRDRDLPAVLAAADCFALMGAGSDESCRAALEAMAAGRPVVARRVGALPDTVVDGETGVLVDDDSAEGVAEALARVLGDREAARRMGRAGRRRAEEVFSLARAVEVVEGVYRAIA
jgi:glycosyltransferase involved in cell wall biosynthesis